MYKLKVDHEMKNLCGIAAYAATQKHLMERLHFIR